MGKTLVANEDLFLSLLSPRLCAEVSKVLDIAKSGFHVCAVCNDPALLSSFDTLLGQGAAFWPSHIKYVSSLGEGEKILSHLHVELGSDFIVVTCMLGTPPQGIGCIPYILKDIVEYLPSPNSTLTAIVKYFGFSHYLEVFDGEITTLLKQILAEEGLCAIVDVVAEVAYWAGHCGEAEKAKQNLLKRTSKCTQQNTSYKKNGIQLGAQVAVSEFFNHVVSKYSNPHAIIKAALSCYMVQKQGNSISGASRCLQVSRTTLQGHMKLAKTYQLDTLF